MTAGGGRGHLQRSSTFIVVIHMVIPEEELGRSDFLEKEWVQLDEVA